jgi:stage IV sporulation protein FB
MLTGIQIGRLFGTDIFVHPSFILLLVVVFFLVPSEDIALAATGGLTFILSILVHEFGHVFAVRRFLGSSSAVILSAIGGLTLHEATSSRKKRVGISLMGPAFGLVLGLAFLGIQRWAPLNHAVASEFVRWMVLFNIVWTAINLLPVHPLDGGQALLAALEYKLPARRARRAVAWVSVVTAGGGMAAALAFGWGVAGIFALFLLIQNLRLLRS